MDFGEKLKKYITWQGIKQTELAKELKTTQSNISNWVTGRNYPTVKQLIKLCIILDCTPNDLLDFNTD